MNKELSTVVETLQQAVEAVEEAGVPTDLRSAALPQAIRLLSAERTPTPRPIKEPVSGDGGSTGDPSLNKLANDLGISSEVLSEVYVIRDGDLKLAVPSRNISASKKEGTAQIAVLVAVGRQGTGIDGDLTSIREVRKWATEFNRYDSKHFGEHVQSADHLLTIVGKGQQREMRVKWHEREQLRDSILRIAGRE